MLKKCEYNEKDVKKILTIYKTLFSKDDNFNLFKCEKEIRLSLDKMKNLQDELSEKKINYWNLEAQKKKDYSLAQQ